MKKWGQGDASEDRAVCHQAWGPEFDQDHSGRKERTNSYHEDSFHFSSASELPGMDTKQMKSTDKTSKYKSAFNKNLHKSIVTFTIKLIFE